MYHQSMLRGDMASLFVSSDTAELYVADIKPPDTIDAQEESNTNLYHLPVHQNNNRHQSLMT